MEKTKLFFHLIYCKACRDYTSRNHKLTQVLQGTHPKSMSKATKERLKERLHREMNK